MPGTQAVDRTATLLIHVLEARRPVTFSELGQRSSLAKSTTSRLLTALELHGLLRRDRSGAFLPGPVVDGYARAADHTRLLADTVRPRLERVVARTGESANLAVARGGEIDVVDQVDGTFLLGTVDWVGRRVPPHASALGKVLMVAGRLPIPTSTLPALTPHTVTDPAELRRQLDRVRRDGYATNPDELEIGLAAVAVPVVLDGEVVAAASVSGPTARFDPHRTRGLAGVLREEFPSARPGSGREAG
jgi:DNA-binding IclR family transcriptional regulator